MTFLTTEERDRLACIARATIYGVKSNWRHVEEDFKNDWRKLVDNILCEVGLINPQTPSLATEKESQPVTMIEDPLDRAAWEARKIFYGRDTPEWDKLSEESRDVWRSVARAVLHGHGFETKKGPTPEEIELRLTCVRLAVKYGSNVFIVDAEAIYDWVTSAKK